MKGFCETSERERAQFAAAASSGAPPPDVSFDKLGDLYVVFEYVDYDLAGLLDAEYQFSAHEVRSIVLQLLRVLDHLHGLGIVHRDLKTSNLLLRDDHVLGLADFGLSRTLPEAAEQSKGAPDLTNKVITLWYRPPELLLGSVQYAGAVDMWSVGCVMLELMLRKPPFPANVGLWGCPTTVTNVETVAVRLPPLPPTLSPPPSFPLFPFPS